MSYIDKILRYLKRLEIFTEIVESSVKLQLHVLAGKQKQEKRSQGKLAKLMKKEHRAYAFMTE